MYVCVCHAVTDRTIREAASRGVATLEQLQAHTGVGGTCGCCRSLALQILDESGAVACASANTHGLITA